MPDLGTWITSDGDYEYILTFRQGIQDHDALNPCEWHVRRVSDGVEIAQGTAATPNLARKRVALLIAQARMGIRF